MAPIDLSKAGDQTPSILSYFTSFSGQLQFFFAVVCVNAFFVLILSLCGCCGSGESTKVKKGEKKSGGEKSTSGKIAKPKGLKKSTKLPEAEAEAGAEAEEEAGEQEEQEAEEVEEVEEEVEGKKTIIKKTTKAKAKVLIAKLPKIETTKEPPTEATKATGGLQSETAVAGHPTTIAGITGSPNEEPAMSDRTRAPFSTISNINIVKSRTFMPSKDVTKMNVTNMNMTNVDVTKKMQETKISKTNVQQPGAYVTIVSQADNPPPPPPPLPKAATPKGKKKGKKALPKVVPSAEYKTLAMADTEVFDK